MQWVLKAAYSTLGILLLINQIVLRLSEVQDVVQALSTLRLWDPGDYMSLEVLWWEKIQCRV